jgi:hypothetical protein
MCLEGEDKKCPVFRVVLDGKSESTAFHQYNPLIDFCACLPYCYFTSFAFIRASQLTQKESTLRLPSSIFYHLSALHTDYFDHFQDIPCKKYFSPFQIFVHKLVLRFAFINPKLIT